LRESVMQGPIIPWTPNLAPKNSVDTQSG
jgi:hypothetical protein